MTYNPLVGVQEIGLPETDIVCFPPPRTSPAASDVKSQIPADAHMTSLLFQVKSLPDASLAIILGLPDASERYTVTL